MTTVVREHLVLLQSRRLSRKAVVNSLQHRLRDAKREIAPFVARVTLPNHKHTRLMLEEFANFIRAEVPHLCYLDDRVVTLGG